MPMGKGQISFDVAKRNKSAAASQFGTCVSPCPMTSGNIFFILFSKFDKEVAQ